MIGLCISLWLDRQGECPNCGRLTSVKDKCCPHCEYELTENDLFRMNERIKRQYKYSAITGFLFITMFMIIFGILFT